VNHSQSISFASIPTQKQDPRSIAASAVVNATLLIAALVLSPMAHQVVQHQLEYTTLAFPSIPPRVRPAPPVRLRAPKDIPTLRIEPSAIRLPARQQEHRDPQVIKVNFSSPVPVIEEQSSPAVHLAPQPKMTHAFDVAKAPATSNRGNVTAVRFGVSLVNPSATGSAHVAPAGSVFGSVQGGSTSGQVGRVAFSGFGVSAASGPVKAQGQVRSVGFSTPEVKRAAAPVVAAVSETPVIVTNKPIPQYTDEAKKMRVQGDVVLKVTFTAEGSVEIVRVIQGLGHGLDEQAERAARRIEFKPATRNGRAVPVTTEIDIQFELA
jgi:TonB family protein